MKEFKGTPGKCCRGGDMAMTYSDCVYNAKGETVCEAFSINSIEDAQLIAAAPELLEVLTVTMEDIGFWLEQQKPALRNRIEAAIKKALGED